MGQSIKQVAAEIQKNMRLGVECPECGFEIAEQIETNKTPGLDPSFIIVKSDYRCAGDDCGVLFQSKKVLRVIESKEGRER